MKQTHNLHVPMPSELYLLLRTQAKRLGQPATELARQAIRKDLEERQRQSLDAEIEAFAQTAAGTEFDLDEDLENSGLEALQSELERIEK